MKSQLLMIPLLYSINMFDFVVFCFAYGLLQTFEFFTVPIALNVPHWELSKAECCLLCSMALQVYLNGININLVLIEKKKRYNNVLK